MKDPHSIYEVREIDPHGEYWFNLSDTDKAAAFKEKYPNATVSLFDSSNGSDAIFSGEIQVSGLLPHDSKGGENLIPIPSREEFIEMTEAIKADQILRDAAPDMLAALWVAYHSGGMNPTYSKVIKDAIAKAEGHPDYFIDWMKLRNLIQEDNIGAEFSIVPIYNGKIHEVKLRVSEVMERAAWVHSILIEKLKP